MPKPQLKFELPKPVAVVMSSGFFGFFAHAGFLAGLRRLGVYADCLAGSSSGALAAAWAAGGAEPEDILEAFKSVERNDFWDAPKPAKLLRLVLRRFQGRTGYLEGKAYLKLLAQNLPQKNFEDCPTPCLISALDLVSGQRKVFTSGPLAPAVAASGAVPMLFSPVPWNGMLLVDGGLTDKAPLICTHKQFKPASMIIHLLPSSSLEKPAGEYLSRPWGPIRVQARAVDAAREQHYKDQSEALRGQGVKLVEVRTSGITRPGPRSLHLGQQAFDQAMGNTIQTLSMDSAELVPKNI